MDRSDVPSDEANRKPAARTVTELHMQQQLQAAAVAAAHQQPRHQWPYQQQYAQPSSMTAAAAAAAAGLSHQHAASAYGIPPVAAMNQQYSTKPDRLQQQQQLLFQQQQAEIQHMIAQNQQQYLTNAAVIQGGAGGQPSYFPAAAPVYPSVGAMPQPFMQAPRPGRLPAERPLIKLSVSLIDTYKNINTVYYEDRDARRAARHTRPGKSGGTINNGWDDENYDYIITSGELFYGRYKIKERIGKGSFGQVVRAEDIESHREVAIKIIKSKKPFLLQAKTEIELLTHLWEKDPEDQHNIGTASLVFGDHVAPIASVLTTNAFMYGLCSCPILSKQYAC